MKFIVLSYLTVFAVVSAFSQEYLACARKEKVWGFIDESGKWAVNPQFEKAKDFTNKRAMVQKAGDIGWINKSGTYLINPQYPNAFDFYKAN